MSHNLLICSNITGNITGNHPNTESQSVEVGAMGVYSNLFVESTLSLVGFLLFSAEAVRVR